MKTIFCFGEALWDCLPEGNFPGGAPLNVAFHLNQLGVRAFPVTAVGLDPLGRELVDIVRRWGVRTDFIGWHPTLPTGTVAAEINAQGDARYTIREDVAWDDIPVTAQLLSAVGSADAVVYGTLAQRSVSNRLQLEKLQQASVNTFTVCDVNLRPPYDDHERVWKLASQADLVKLNDGELRTLLDDTRERRSLEALARLFATEIGVDAVCVTAGAKGAGLLHAHEWHWCDAKPITTRDTVGAGDAFLAGLISRLLDPHTAPRECLQHACRLGEFVASRHGATPLHAER